jgi:hypothetical protein
MALPYPHESAKGETTPSHVARVHRFLAFLQEQRASLLAQQRTLEEDLGLSGESTMDLRAVAPGDSMPHPDSDLGGLPPRATASIQLPKRFRQML